MTINEVIKFYQELLQQHGDVGLVAKEDDGRSSWVTNYKPMAVQTKDGLLIRQSPYGH